MPDNLTNRISPIAILFPIPYPLFPIPYPLSPIPYPLFPIPYPYSLFPIPYSLFPIPYSLSPKNFASATRSRQGDRQPAIVTNKTFQTAS
jgi:hypothetical protein